MKIKRVSYGAAVGVISAFSFASNYSLEILPSVAGNIATRYSSINDGGKVVGATFYTFQGLIKKQIITYDEQGTVIVADGLRLDFYNSEPLINNSGQVAFTDSLGHPSTQDIIRTYRYTPGLGSEELASPNPNLSYVPLDMNEGGDVVGQSLNSDGWIQNSTVWRADGSSIVLNSSFEAHSIADDRTLSGRTPIGGFVWREGRDPELQTYPGNGGTTGRLNSSGQALGAYAGHNWLWAPDFQSHIEIPIDSGRLLNDGSVIGGQRHGTAPFLGIGK